jgi:hypothetical protein
MLATLAIVGMAWAHMKKQCHTLVQTIGDGVLGIMVVFFLFAIL